MIGGLIEAIRDSAAGTIPSGRAHERVLAYARRANRTRGKPVSNEDAGELARWLRALDLETGIADRIDRATDADGGLIAIDRAGAHAILAVITALQDENPACAERLEELSVDLERHVAGDELTNVVSEFADV